MPHAFFLHAKSILASPARYLAARRQFRAHGSQIARWSDTSNLDEAWDERTQLLARWIAPNSTVLEFGSGRERLETFLPAGCRYSPSDITKRSERTLVCDLNHGFPELTEHYDVIVFAGVAEYIRDLEGLLRNIRKHCTTCITTYTPVESLDCIATRLNNGWVNHYREAELIGMIARAGFTVAATERWRYQTLYKLT